MTRHRTIIYSLLLASGLALAAAPALAMHECGAGDMHGDKAHMQKDHKKLHHALKLSAEQEIAWTKLTDTEKSMAKMPMHKADDTPRLSTPERADKMLERMKEHEAMATEHVAALKEFYAVLTPDQQKIFDDFHTGSHRARHAMSRHHAPKAAKTAP